MQRLKDWLVYLLVRTCICIVQAVSIETCSAFARVAAWLACDVVRLRRAVIDENLTHAFPEMSAAQRHRLARAMWEHLVLMVCEIAQVPRKVHETNWRKYVYIRRVDVVVRAFLSPRANVLVSGHFGNFEFSGYLCGLLGVPTYTIARRLDNPYLNAYVNRFRGAKGQYILPKDGSSGDVERVLAGHGSLALLGDQHAGIKGCWVEFMGRQASCHKALALFSLGTPAPLLVSYAMRRGRPLHFELGFEDILDPTTCPPEQANVKYLTQWYNRALERVIRRAPEQYWWVHRRWKEVQPRRGKGAVERTASGAAESPAPPAEAA